MKKRMLFSLSVLVILALTLISASPVAARAAKTPVCSLQTNTGETGGQTLTSPFAQYPLGLERVGGGEF